MKKRTNITIIIVAPLENTNCSNDSLILTAYATKNVTRSPSPNHLNTFDKNSLFIKYHLP